MQAWGGGKPGDAIGPPGELVGIPIVPQDEGFITAHSVLWVWDAEGCGAPIEIGPQGLEATRWYTVQITSYQQQD